MAKPGKRKTAEDQRATTRKAKVLKPNYADMSLDETDLAQDSEQLENVKSPPRSKAPKRTSSIKKDTYMNNSRFLAKEQEQALKDLIIDKANAIATHNAHLQAMFLSAFSKTLDHYGGTNANYLHQVVGEEIRHPFHHTANIILDCSRKLIQRYENIDIGDHLQTRSLGITDRWNVDCQRLNKLFSMEMKKTGFQTKRALGGNHKIPKKYGGEQGSPAGIDLWTRFAVQPKKDGGVEPAHREHWASTARRAESGVRRLMKNV